MKGKRISIAMGVVIFLLVIYAIVSLKDRPPALPELPRWKEGADEIIVEKASEKVRIYKKAGKWYVGDEGFPADEKLVEKMEEKMRDIVISDVSSQTPYYERFDLTPNSAIHVVVKRGGEVLRDVYLGKRSDKTNHTYIRVAGRNEVFKASGTFSYDFDKKIDDIRDKTIFEFKSDEIEAFEIQYKGIKTALARTKVENEKAKETKEKTKDEASKEQAKKDEYKWVFANTPTKQVDDGAIHAVINSFNPLRANSFPMVDKNLLKNPYCTLKVTAKGKTHELFIYKGKEPDQYVCTASTTPYVFQLSKYSAEQYFRTPKDFEKRP
ncbi:MAG: DUF4340 domain-containing protein [Spirochaetes bacterium]|nr:DUF4340 domain-containing protein [Spirochaetota bacterium]